MDYDKEYFTDSTPLDYLISFARKMHPLRFEYNQKELSNHFQIFKTKGGFHLVQILDTWKLVKERLLFFQRQTGVKYEMDPKQIRLRISPKWKYETGRIMSRAPKLVYSCSTKIANQDIRFSNRTKKQYYFTLKM